ncbi:MAG: ABC transporter substrate-binding protein [Actinomycetota bacterium]
MGFLRATKLVALAFIIGFIAFKPGESPDFANAGGAGGPVPGTEVPIDSGVPDTGIPDSTGPSTGTDIPSDSGGSSGGSGGTTDGSGLSGGSGKNLTCNRSGNGGATDVGVTASEIKLASTVVQSGPGSSFLGDSPTGMSAVVRKINSQGGICGRLLKLQLVDDGWDAARGLGFIKTFIAEKNFALPVVPSSEGLTAAISAGEIRKAGIPVIGTDGMLKQQYEDPWVWPVATATVSTMRIIAKHAYSKGARCFGIVWDTRYKFGKEGEQAFVEFVKKLPGAKVCGNQGILPARASYSSEIQSFNSSCSGKCDAVALLLEPQTALTWINGRPEMGDITSGAQPLFNETFARNCGEKCSGMLVWTGYNPPIGALESRPGVREYVNDVRSVSPTVDVKNQFLEGAYLGMTVFVEALKAVGPELTRARLAAVMNSKTFQHDIAQKLSWTTGNRNANCSAQAFRLVTAQGSFADFANEQTGFIKDPTC